MKTIKVHLLSNTAKVLGYEMPDATVIVRTSTALVIKIPGHKYWSGLGYPWSYALAEYQVYKVHHVAQEKPGEDILYCDEVIGFPVRSKNGHS